MSQRTGDARSLPAAAQAALRRRAVKVVRAGKTQGEVAELFGVTRRAVNRWVRMAEKSGLAALKAARRGRPAGGGRLSPAQAAVIRRLIRDRTPDQLRLAFYLWTREAVAQRIEQRLGLALSVWTVGRYLAAWGFTPQRPVRRAFERDPQAVRRWLKEEYPAIRTRAKRERAEIYWGEEMGLRSDHAAGRSFSPRGETPVIPGTGRRFGCNMISAITNKGKLLFMVFRKGFTAAVFLEFLKRLERQVGRPLYLIVDGHPVHRARPVQAWLNAKGRRIRLFFLPGYSPELNPDELLNQDVKSNALGRRRARDQAELLQNVRGYLRGRQRQPHVVRNYFREEHVRYAAE
jgi:transposase